MKQKETLPLGIINTERMNHEIFRLLRKRIDEQADTKLTVEEFLLIYMLSEKGDHVIQKNLAEALGKDKSAIFRLVSSLEQKSLIKRVECGCDKRKNYLVVTKKGNEVLRQYQQIESGLINELKHGLTELEIAVLYKVINRIRINAEKL
ncbi:MAG: MarR family winged helix-turn-helix transcriptional regulator [Mangrovibacterium sp.]